MSQEVAQDWSRRAALYKLPELEGAQICHFSFARLTHRCDDMRSLLPALTGHPHAIDPGEVVIDSDMKLYQAFQGLASDCPDEIVAQQQLLRAFYWGTDGKLHHGQVVIHEDLASDVMGGFNVMLKEGIPIGSVIPMSHPTFLRGGAWDDELSMESGNSGGFNYRRMLTPTGKQQRLSLHGLGMALDINPLSNPCYGAPSVHAESGYSHEAAAGYRKFIPVNGVYDLCDPKTFHGRHPLVLFLKERGWTWGGDWADPKDFHHFQKIPAGREARVQELRAPKGV